MKLRNADQFGKAAGSCWRLLFVYALFPWLSRYRISSQTLNKEGRDDCLGRDAANAPLPPLTYASIRKIAYSANSKIVNGTRSQERKFDQETIQTLKAEVKRLQDQVMLLKESPADDMTWTSIYELLNDTTCAS